MHSIDGIMRTKKGSIVSITDEDDIVFEQLSHLRTSHPQMPLKHLPIFLFPWPKIGSGQEEIAGSRDTANCGLAQQAQDV